MPQTITPYLLYEDGEAAIEFATRAFGFREANRATGVAGGLHAELELGAGGGRIYLGQPSEGFRNPSEVGRTSQLYILVEDVDAHYERAAAAGAKIIEEPNDLPFGPAPLRLRGSSGPRVVLRPADRRPGLIERGRRATAANARRRFADCLPVTCGSTW